MGRRAETSEYLAECIADALLQLMSETPIDKIKIQDITDLAKVGRVTYFRYFNSKEDVLLFKIFLLLDRWSIDHSFPQNGNLREEALWFFSFCHSNQKIFDVLVQQDQFNVILDMVKTVSMNTGTEIIKSTYLRTYSVYGITGILICWFRNKCKETPEELADICAR